MRRMVGRGAVFPSDVDSCGVGWGCDVWMCFVAWASSSPSSPTEVGSGERQKSSAPGVTWQWLHTRWNFHPSPPCCSRR
eukprot:179359-Rhodomonas_salina.1